MASISEHRQKALRLNPFLAATPAELQFLISDACIRYWDASPKDAETLIAIIAALESSKLELYSRLKENSGDTN